MDFHKKFLPQIGVGPRMAPLNFGDERSKVKVKVTENVKNCCTDFHIIFSTDRGWAKEECIKIW